MSYRNSGEICAERGFQVGDVLEGDEGYGPTRILLTAIGEQVVLAKYLGHRSNSDPKWNAGPEGFESSWTLTERDWYRVDPEAPWPESA